MLKILAISGSLRQQSTNTQLLKYLQKQFSSQARISIFNQLADIPHFSPDLDIDPLPKSVIALRKQISQADAVIFCTPEYVFSLPGVLKNAIEWTVSTTVFSEKPTAIITASTEGTKAHEALNLIIRTIYADVRDEMNLLLQGVRGKLDSQGNITDLALKQRIDNAMNNLLKALPK